MDTNIKIKSWVWEFLAGLLAVFLLVSIFIKIPEIRSVFQSSLPANTISMSAEGKISAVPDLATINMGVVTTALSASKAQSDNAAKVNAVIDFVKGQGIDKSDIATTQLNVSPQYDYAKGTNTITGYQARQTISVKVRGVDQSTQVLGSIIDGANAAGANEIDGVDLSFNDPDNLRQEARKQAIDKAKQQATELADQAGLKLGRVVSIQEGSAGYPTPVPYTFAGMAKSADSAVLSTAPNVEPGNQDITASITVIFEVK